SGACWWCWASTSLATPGATRWRWRSDRDRDGVRRRAGVALRLRRVPDEALRRGRGAGRRRVRHAGRPARLRARLRLARPRGQAAGHPAHGLRPGVAEQVVHGARRPPPGGAGRLVAERPRGPPPSWIRVPGLDPEAVTLEHLLSHTSGVPP